MGAVLTTIEEFDPGNDGPDTLLVLPHRLAKGHNIAMGEKGGGFRLQGSRKLLSRFTDVGSVM